MRAMACTLMLAAVWLLLDGLAFGIRCRPGEFDRSNCDWKKTHNAAHRLAEGHPFR